MSVFNFNIHDASPFKQLIEMISSLTTENIYMAVSNDIVHLVTNVPNYLNIRTDISTSDLLDFNFNPQFGNMIINDTKFFVFHFESKKFCDQIKYVKKKSNLNISHDKNSDSIKMKGSVAGENYINIHKSVELSKFLEIINVSYIDEASVIKKPVDISIQGIINVGEDIKLKHSKTGFIFYKNQDIASSMYKEGEIDSTECCYYADIKKTKVLSKVNSFSENGIITYYSGNEKIFRIDLSLSYYGRIRISFINKKDA